MASNLRVDTILPSSGTTLGIGTASGTTTVTGTLNAASATITGNLGVGGTLTYEDVTNVDSVGVVTARSGIRIGTGGTVGPVGSGIVTYFGDGSQLTGAGPSLTGSTNNTIVTVTGANAIQGESNLVFTGTRLGLNKTSPAPLNGDGTGMIHVAGGNPELVLERTTAGTESKASIRVTDGEDFKIAVKDGSGSTIDALAIDTGTGIVTKPAHPIASLTCTNSLGTGNILQTGTVSQNNGNHWDSSNHRFICPVAGFYYCAMMIMSNNSNTTMDADLLKNGNIGDGTNSNFFAPYQAATGGQYNQISGSCILQCAAGDYLQFRLNSGSVYAGGGGRHSHMTFALFA